MKQFEKLVRPNILTLQPYRSAREECQLTQGVFLDANENPYGSLNRYPDPYQNALKEILSQQKLIAKENIFIGNGSDEIIDLLIRLFCRPGEDRILSFSPSYGMYKVCADINAVQFDEISLNAAFDIDEVKVLSRLTNGNYKILFICSPNNPTGNLLNTDAILSILRAFGGVVVIDEAYIDFSRGESWVRQIEAFNNLVVLQTLSKSRGLASARIGIAYGASWIIKYLNNIKPPYNVSQLNQDAAIKVLSNNEAYDFNTQLIQNEKDRLVADLRILKCVNKIYPSDANFFLVEFGNANDTYNYLLSKGIVVRNRHTQFSNCLRISIGSKEENDKLVNALKSMV